MRADGVESALLLWLIVSKCHAQHLGESKKVIQTWESHPMQTHSMYWV